MSDAVIHSSSLDTLLSKKRILDNADVPKGYRVIHTTPVIIAKALGVPVEEVEDMFLEDGYDVKP